MANDIKLSQLAEELGVSSRSVSAWVYEGRVPGKQPGEGLRLFGLSPSHSLQGGTAGQVTFNLPAGTFPLHETHPDTLTRQQSDSDWPVHGS